MLAEIYREEWGLDAMLDSQVLRETQAIFGKAIEKGVPRSTPHRTAFKQRLKTSTDVFSVFRVHRQAEDIAAHLTDEHGNRRSFGEWAERVQPYLNHHNRAWLQTEYSTAIRRAHDEADWVRFREDADIYPNLEWVPSTSAQPGADHKVFWGTVLPIGDEFWTEHRPGDRWNCKCSLRQTDKAPTATPRVSGRQHEPQAGLRTKPGREEVFSDDHAYFPSDCRMCLFGRSASRLRHLLGNLGGKGGRTLASSCYECRYRAACMEKEYREVKTERGSVRIHAKHGKNETRSNTETATYLANKHGYDIDLLPDLPNEKSADSYNRTLGKEQEYKEILSPTNNAIQKQIQKARKQANSIVLVVKGDCSLGVLTTALNDRVRRYDSITDVTLIINGKDATYTREQIIRDDFKISRDDFK